MDQQNIVVRHADGSDAPAIHGLSAQLGYSSTLDAARERLGRLLAAPANAVFVAERASADVVGWIHVFEALRVESETFAEVGGLVVTKRLRGRGIGGALLAEAEKWARERGVAELRIRSRSDRAEAHRFFEHFGMTRSKTQEVFDARV